MYFKEEAIEYRPHATPKTPFVKCNKPQTEGLTQRGFVLSLNWGFGYLRQG